MKKLKAIDFFCGAGGMTAGFTKAGIKVIAGIDIDKTCKETYVKNNTKSKFIEADIKLLTNETLIKKTGIRQNDDNLIFIGCSPCQYWSKIKTDKSKSTESKNLLKDFQKFVAFFKPGYVVIENVPGILNKFDESPLKDFLKFLEQEGYKYDFRIVNASHYGVPQTRRRFLLLSSRVNDSIALPTPDTKENPPTVRQFISSKRIFKPIRAGHRDNSLFMHTSSDLSSTNIERLKLTPKDGGSRKSWKDTPLQIPTYVNRDNSFHDIYGRMFWDKPAPTLTTKFYSISNGRFAHPEQDRAISLREGATLQTFDFNYNFYASSIANKAKLIGNAVPPELAFRIAKSLQ
ncbi:MAG: DNA cytosine methyltransferase [Ignavibacteriae bacterium]|nr:DNA cytosine methyltransferase [Ignavibacteriota bacterium]